MEINTGICRFGLWRVRVEWSDDLIHRISFIRTGDESYIPVQIKQFLTGKKTDLSPLKSIALSDGYPFSEIYRAVMEIPYGETRTYSEIGKLTGTHHRTVGVAMRRNPTPLIIPCHRVISKNGPGGFTPDIEIKKSLIKMENKVLKSL